MAIVLEKDGLQKATREDSVIEQVSEGAIKGETGVTEAVAENKEVAFGAAAEMESEAAAVSEENESLSQGGEQEEGLSQDELAREEKLTELRTATENLAALNNAFDELIKECRENGAMGFVGEVLRDYCKSGDNKLINLRATKEKAVAERAELVAKIAEQTETLFKTHVDAEMAKAVRDGVAIDVAVQEKLALLAETENTLKAYDREIEHLEESYAYNEAVVRLCKERNETIFKKYGATKKSLAGLVAVYNKLEQEKQAIYRDQIISASMLQEINAVDGSVSENTDMIKSSLDNRLALESAKQTLLGYIQKCKKNIEDKTEELISVRIERKYYDGLETLKFGDSCPVCSSKVTAYLNCGKKIAILDAKKKALNAEINTLKGILRGYKEKLEKININIGAYHSAEKVSAGYIDSLNATKIAKMNVLKKVYAENGVKDHGGLTAKLERKISDIAELGGVLADIKANAAREEAANKAKEDIMKVMNELRTELIPAKRADFAARLKDVEEFRVEFDKMTKLISGADPIALAEEVESMEIAEDKLFVEVVANREAKEKLDGQIANLDKQIAIYEGHLYDFVRNGKKVGYAELCTGITSDLFGEAVEEIRKQEAIADSIVAELDAIDAEREAKNNA